MQGEVRAFLVYEGESAVLEGYSLEQTGAAYSFGWMYSPGEAVVEICEGSFAVVRQSGRRLAYSIYSLKPSGCWEDRVDEVPDIVGAHEDYREFHAIARGDPLVGGVVEAAPGLRLRRLGVWAASLVAVAQQNASFRQGWGMVYRLYKIASRRILLKQRRGSKVVLQTPSPEEVSIELLRRAGYGYRAQTVLYISAELKKLGADIHACSVDAIERLAEVSGVGPYTYNLVKLLACRDYQALPVDRWLEALASEAYGVDRSQVQQTLTARFGRWRGLAAYFTTIGFDAQPLRKALARLREGKNKPGLAEPSPMSLWKYTPP
ncbi:MAG: hypothetical protein ABWW70_05680 [Thermoproteota archaeon]